MRKSINNGIAYIGSTLVIGVKLPKVDDLYSFSDLLADDRITGKYFIINTGKKYSIDSFFRALGKDDADYDNLYQFTVDTTDLSQGVLMVELTVRVPPHGTLPGRVEVAVCSTGIAIIKDE